MCSTQLSYSSFKNLIIIVIFYALTFTFVAHIGIIIAVTLIIAIIFNLIKICNLRFNAISNEDS